MASSDPTPDPISPEPPKFSSSPRGADDPVGWRPRPLNSPPSEETAGNETPNFDGGGTPRPPSGPLPSGSHDIEFVSGAASDPLPVDESDLLAGGVQDRYKVLDVIGEGGFGTVYLAEDRVLKQRVAIKVLHLGNTDERTRQRFIFEARTAANLRHSGIVNVFDIAQTSDGLQQVMEYYPGGTLKDRVERDGAIPLKQSLKITHRILDALAFAHGKGIVHRDIKPANIFFAEDGSIKIGDFGLCTSFERHDHTMTGESMGTPLYMAPEQMKDAKDVDQRADVYSVGLTLYYMLTGERPVVVDIAMLPAAVRPVISRATAQLRDRRLGSCDAFKAMIDEILPLIESGSGVRSVDEAWERERLFDSAVLKLPGAGPDVDSTRTGQENSFSGVGRSLSVAVIAAVIGAFLTLGIVGGYITLTSNRTGESRISGAMNPLPTDATSGPSRPDGSGDRIADSPPPDSGAEISEFSGSSLDDDGRALFPPSPTEGSRTGLTGSGSGEFPRRSHDGARPRPSGQTPQGGPGELLDLPFFFPQPALRPLANILSHLRIWIEIDQGDPESGSLAVAAEMLQGGRQVDRRNPVYPYLMGRISERLEDEASARDFYAEVHQMGPILMSDPEESMRKIAAEAGVEIPPGELEALLFGRPAETFRSTLR